MIPFLASLALALPQSTPQEGYTLFSPLDSTETYLIDVDYNIVHTWADNLQPGKAVYLMDNGNLLRTYRVGGQPASLLDGDGGGVHVLRWGGSEVWNFQLANSNELLHHDVEVLPNGNILMLAWENKTDAGAISAGHDPGTLSSSYFWTEKVLELDPTTGTIVWEWHLWDHLVQDFDSYEANFGVVADSPQLVNINFPASPDPNGDWAHVNTVKYNAEFDQIVLSSRNLSEIWIIDHSTSTAEAAGHTGGTFGKGGDLLYRWGNPQAYDRGTSGDQLLFGQHDIQWIPDGYPGEGNFLVFNNGLGRSGSPWSSVEEFTPPVDALGNYSLVPSAAYGPAASVWSYSDTPATFYANHISGAERMPNGNTLICDGPSGRLFEVDPLGTVVWDWTNIYPNPSTNKIFKARRYQRWLWSEKTDLTALFGDTIDFDIVGGSARAGDQYVLLGSRSGSTPSSVVNGGLEVPLVFDSFTINTRRNAGSGHFQNFSGVLDGNGNATAKLNTGGPISVSLIGRTIYFAYMLIDGTTGMADFSSNPVAIEIIP
ncbi:MAG: hypothetical protein GY747_04525 [Planctomycetes bacterium]|nr:hypothetical protein [Planctomycetota bacterium]MCP4771478.1 hypothetical protein [Planctomycetota bacterium]MCP4861139.1 hypothetical protein [Planctomycetota bacterium]